MAKSALTLALICTAAGYVAAQAPSYGQVSINPLIQIPDFLEIVDTKFI